MAVAMVWGCSGSKPKQSNDVNSSPVIADPIDDPIADSDPIEDEPIEDDGDEPSPKKVDPRDDNYEINHRDCAALARAYGRSWLGDELDKLNAKKLKTAQHEKFQSGLEDDSKEMADQYQGECDKTVGTAYLRSRLACAVKAKKMKRFNDCMDGNTGD